MADIKEFKPKLTVDPQMLRVAEEAVERVKSGELVGLGIVFVERKDFNCSHAWGGSCPRNAIIGALYMLMNRIMGNLQEDWAQPFDSSPPGPPVEGDDK